MTPQVTVQAAQLSLSEVVQRLPIGGTLRASGIAIEGLVTDTLDLSRFSVFSDDAQILIDDAYSLPAPATAYFRGAIAGDPESIAVLAIPETGSPRGLLLSPSGIWMIEEQLALATRGLTARKLGRTELVALKSFRCGTEGLGLLPEVLGGNAAPDSISAPGTAAATAAYTARVAVETDAEYYLHFNDTAKAISYVGDLFAYASSIYEREIGTGLTVSHLSLWTGGTASDPWTVTSGTTAALKEFVNYWNSNRTGVDRTIAHMLSGKGLGGGIAYVGALCDRSYGYGLSSSLNYNYFPGSTTQTIWDTLVVTHEIGHNFNSPHSHCYAGIDGVNSAIDQCYGSESGCYQGTTSLPGLGSTTGGTSGAKNGTIMSYCHQLGGGYGNIAMTFGTGHPYGVLAERVPQRMSSFVQSRASANPGCLAPVASGPVLTVTKAGVGTGSVTSSDSGINCGTDCTQSYAANASVSLTASPAVGSLFGGWTGACSATTPSTSVMMDTNKTCTAMFNPATATSIHVGDLDATKTRSWTSWSTRITVTVHDAQHKPVANAKVSGSWSAGATGSATCTTNTAGQCTVSLSSLRTSVASVTLTVNNATATGYSYSASANHDPETDSNGTTIKVSRP